jgi:hypothetical protein
MRKNKARYSYEHDGFTYCVREWKDSNDGVSYGSKIKENLTLAEAKQLVYQLNGWAK